MRWGPDGSLVPAAAELVEEKDDGTTLIFAIRETARWSDGTDLVAEDFARGFRHAVDPANHSPQSSLLVPIQNAAKILDGEMPPSRLGVAALSDKQLQIKLESVTPYFLTLLDYPLTYPRHPKTEVGKPNESNGAYRLKDNKRGHATRLIKNVHYWAESGVDIPEVKYLHLETESTQVNLFRSGELHLTSTVPSVLTPLLKEKYPDELHLTPQLGTYYYALNVTSGPLQANVLRRGLVAAVDTEEMVTSLLTAGQSAAHSLVPPHVWSLPTKETREAIELERKEDLRVARDWLLREGYSRDNPLKLRLLINTGDNHKKIALYTQAAWQSSLDVSIEIETVDFKVLLDRQRSKDSWDIVRTSWTADFPDAINFLDTFGSDSPNNIPGFSDKRFDELLRESTTNSPEREKLLKEADAIVRDSASALFLYHYVDRRLVSKRITNFQPNRLAIYRSQDLRLGN